MKYAVKHKMIDAYVRKAGPWDNVAWTLTRTRDTAHRFLTRSEANAARSAVDVPSGYYEVIPVDPDEWEAGRDPSEHP